MHPMEDPYHTPASMSLKRIASPLSNLKFAITDQAKREQSVDSRSNEESEASWKMKMAGIDITIQCMSFSKSLR
jgi:hypothetical protein